MIPVRKDPTVKKTKLFTKCNTLIVNTNKNLKKQKKTKKKLYKKKKGKEKAKGRRPALELQINTAR